VLTFWMTEPQPSIIKRLQIKVVPESELRDGYKPVTISLAVSDPDVASMWSTLKSCGAVGTLGADGRITFWRHLPDLTGAQKYRRQFTLGHRVDTGCKTGGSGSRGR
jgi:hypothetical protein